MKHVLGGLVVALAAATARADNLQLNMYADPPANGAAYQDGEIVRVAVRLAYANSIINSLELSQVDLNLTNASLVPQYDPNDNTSPIFDPVVFGGAAAGDGEGPDMEPNTDGFPGPQLPGCPAGCLIGSVPSAQGGGTIYFWLRTNTATTALLNPPATSGPNSMFNTSGRLFIQFKVTLHAGTDTIDALGPSADDGSSSGAFSQQAGTATRWANGDPITGPDPNNVNNYVGGILTLQVVPEPASLALLALGALAAIRRRR
jgi:hypothetical protein